MPIEEDINAGRRLQKAQILLDLFTEDCGRAADSLEEVGEWAVKNRGHLEVRMGCRLLELELLRRNSEQQVDRLPAGSASLPREPTRDRNFLRRFFGAKPQA